ncbi:MAG: hypothetical protein GX255_05850 [Erysipelotrichia bacterium]|nr:hypothetical protein [Erysipelotrichia bacterium]
MYIQYINFQQKFVQGTEREIFRTYGKDWTISKLGNGPNWLVTKECDNIINGKSYRDDMLIFYGASRLTPDIIEKFKKDFAEGKIKLF